jgi:hypothetical protein
VVWGVDPALAFAMANRTRAAPMASVYESHPDGGFGPGYEHPSSTARSLRLCSSTAAEHACYVSLRR